MGTTFAEIKKEFMAERDARGALASPDVLPISHEEITNAWLTSVLGEGHPGAEVVSHRLGPKDEGTSSRRRIFLTWNDAGIRANRPASVFCKATQRLESRYILGMNGGIAGEVTFYKVVRPRLAIEAPEAYFASFHPQSFNSIIIMRDLGEEARFCAHARPAAGQAEDAAAGGLARVHQAHDARDRRPGCARELRPLAVLSGHVA